MLNMVDTLMEIGVHKNWQNTKGDDPPQPGSVDPFVDFGRDKDKDSKVNMFQTYCIVFHSFIHV